MSAFDPVSVDSLKKQNFLLKIREEAWKARTVRENKRGKFTAGVGLMLLPMLFGSTLVQKPLPTLQIIGCAVDVLSLASMGIFLFMNRRAGQKFKKTIKALGREIKQAKLKARRQAEGWPGIDDPWRRQPKVRGVSVRALAR